MVSQLAPGDRILDYVLLEHVGSGGFGDVFRAEHGVLRKIVAIKIPRDEDFVRALGVEGALQHGMTHEGIVGTVEVHLSHDPPFLALDYVDGPSLRKIIEDEGALRPERALRLAAQIARALAHAHERGVVHGDVKPENALVARAGREDEEVRLTDFGLGRVLEGVQGSFLISRSLANAARRGDAAAGTLRYIAPEVLEGETIEPAADVFAFGVVLFEMLTGTAPAGSEAPSALRVDLPDEVDELFHACFARRQRRLADGAALLPRIEAALAAVRGQKKPAVSGGAAAKSAPSKETPEEKTTADVAAEGGPSEFEQWRERLLNGVRRRLLDRQTIAVVNPRGLDLGVSRPPGGPRHQVLLHVVDKLDPRATGRLLARAERIWERHKGLWECEVTFAVVARDVPQPEKVLWEMRGFAVGWWRRRRMVLIDTARNKTHARELGSSLRDSALRKEVVGAAVDAADEIAREDSPEIAGARRRGGASVGWALATMACLMAACLLVKTAVLMAVVAGVGEGTAAAGWIGSIQRELGIQVDAAPAEPVEPAVVDPIEAEPEPDLVPKPSRIPGQTPTREQAPQREPF